MVNDNSLFRGTTPVMSIVLDLTAAQAAKVSKWYLTLKQGNVSVEWTGTTVSLTTDKVPYIEVTATQAQTLSLSEGPAELQLRLLTSDGEADASDVFDVMIGPVLKDGEIS
jgi:hypothetical protein